MNQTEIETQKVVTSVINDILHDTFNATMLQENEENDTEADVNWNKSWRSSLPADNADKIFNGSVSEFLKEIDRGIFRRNLADPVNGSDEYFQAAENYALYGTSGKTKSATPLNKHSAIFYPRKQAIKLATENEISKKPNIPKTDTLVQAETNDALVKTNVMTTPNNTAGYVQMKPQQAYQQLTYWQQYAWYASYSPLYLDPINSLAYKFCYVQQEHRQFTQIASTMHHQHYQHNPHHIHVASSVRFDCQQIVVPMLPCPIRQFSNRNVV